MDSHDIMTISNDEKTSKQHQPSGTATTKGKSKAGRPFQEERKSFWKRVLQQLCIFEAHTNTYTRFKNIDNARSIQHYTPLPLPLKSSSASVAVLHPLHNADVLLSVQCLWIMNIGFSLASEVDSGQEGRQQSLLVFVFRCNLQYVC